MGGGNAEGTLDILMFHILINHTCITNEPEEENTCQTSEEDARQIELAQSEHVLQCRLCRFTAASSSFVRQTLSFGAEIS